MYFKAILEYLNRARIIKIMKGLFFFIPIILITHRLFVNKFGTYEVICEFDYCLKFLTIELNRWLYTLLVFFGIFGLSYFCEQYFFPILLRLAKPFKKHKRRHMFLFVRLFVSKRVKTIFNIEQVEEVTTDMPTDVLDMYRDFAFIPIVITLWMIFINTLLSYIVIIVVILVSIFISKVMNTYVIEYKIKNPTR